jgi:fructose-1-phosphate kinase PfkB-like protein
MFLDDATIQRSNIGAGDEVVIAGLFSKIRLSATLADCVYFCASFGNMDGGDHRPIL